VQLGTAAYLQPVRNLLDSLSGSIYERYGLLCGFCFFEELQNNSMKTFDTINEKLTLGITDWEEGIGQVCCGGEPIRIPRSIEATHHTPL